MTLQYVETFGTGRHQRPYVVGAVIPGYQRHPLETIFPATGEAGRREDGGRVRVLAR